MNERVQKKNNAGRVWVIDKRKGQGANKLGNMIRFESFGNGGESKVKDEEIRKD